MREIFFLGFFFYVIDKTFGLYKINKYLLYTEVTIGTPHLKKATGGFIRTVLLFFSVF